VVEIDRRARIVLGRRLRLRMRVPLMIRRHGRRRCLPLGLRSVCNAHHVGSHCHRPAQYAGDCLASWPRGRRWILRVSAGALC
jgi:hypothetical protein